MRSLRSLRRRYAARFSSALALENMNEPRPQYFKRAACFFGVYALAAGFVWVLLMVLGSDGVSINSDSFDGLSFFKVASAIGSLLAFIIFGLLLMFPGGIALLFNAPLFIGHILFVAILFKLIVHPTKLFVLLFAVLLVCNSVGCVWSVSRTF